jgi:hypothetical protein
MSALHHVSMALDDPGWAVMAGAVYAGDSVVLLDRAARELQLGIAANAAATLWTLLAQGSRVRWLLPAMERVSDAFLPDTVEVIDEAHWLHLVVGNPLLLEWS